MAAQLPERTRPRIDVTVGRPVLPAALPSTLPIGPAATGARDNWPLLIFLFFLPLQNLQTGYMPNFGAGFNFLNIMFLLSLWGTRRVGIGLVSGASVNRWIVVYIIYSLLSLCIGYGNVHSNTEEHFNFLKDHLIAVMVVFLVQMSVRDWDGLKKVLIAIVLPLPYMAKVIWAQHPESSHYKDALRISGTFSLLGANEFSAFCATLSLVLLGLLIATRMSLRFRGFLLLGIGCSILGVLYTYSRTGYVAVLLGAAAILLAWRGRWKMLLPILLAAAILPSTLPDSVTERFESTTLDSEKRDESTDSRFQFWDVAWGVFEQHPLLGTGYHTFHHKEINPFGMDTHNFFMRTLAEQGLAGACVVLGLLFSVFGLIVRTLRQSTMAGWAYGLSLGMLGAWVALICGNCFGDRFTHYPMIACFWAFVGLLLRARSLLLAESEATHA